ncbi:MAG: hypothetical protein A2064_08285 [Spirochaetes bacterium GWB1_66_5]|nr:MAG: hypothetical protein A2064_08285 [Spirochaetes bacterium GWB1_66_5]
MAGHQVLPGQAHGGLHHGLGQAGQPARQLLEIRQRVQDVGQLQAEDFPVLELVEGPALLLQGAALPDRLVEQPRQDFRGRAQAPRVRLQHGQQRLVLQADEILPQEVAGPQQPRQLLQHARVGQQLQPAALLRLDGLHQALEAVQGGVRVRGPAQEVGELLGQQHRQLDLVEHRRIGDAPAAGVQEGELVLNAVVHGADADVVDEDRPQGQGGAQGVEEQWGVLGNHAQQGSPALPRADGDLGGVQDRFRAQRQAGEVHGGQLVHPLAGLGQAHSAALLHQVPHLAQQAAQAGFPQLQRLAFGQAAGKVVDDPPPGQVAGFLAGLRADIPVGVQPGFLTGLRPREHVPGEDVEAGSPQDAGDDRELPRIVEGDHRAVDLLPGPHQHLHRLPGGKGGQRGQVLGHFPRGKQLEVAVLQAAQVLAHQLGVHARGQAVQLGEGGFHGWTKENLPAGR